MLRDVKINIKPIACTHTVLNNLEATLPLALLCSEEQRLCLFLSEKVRTCCSIQMQTLSLEKSYIPLDVYV